MPCRFVFVGDNKYLDCHTPRRNWGVQIAFLSKVFRDFSKPLFVASSTRSILLPKAIHLPIQGFGAADFCYVLSQPHTNYKKQSNI